MAHPSHLQRCPTLRYSIVMLRRKLGIKKWPLMGCGIIVLLIIFGWAIWRARHSQPNTIPKTLTSQITTFRPYFYPGGIPDGFALDSRKASFDGTLLMLPLTNAKGQQVTITEQALPAQLNYSKVQGSENIAGAFGSAALSFDGAHPFAILLSKDKKTMANISTAASVGEDVIKDLARSLRPI